MMMSVHSASLLFLILCLVLGPVAALLQVGRASIIRLGGGGGVQQSRTSSTSPLLHAIPNPIARWRNRGQRKVDQKKEIQVGDVIPDMDVEQLLVQNDGSVGTNVGSITDILGTGKSILVGMPGAFTETCSREHLPGFVEQAEKLQRLGYDKIVVITNNDRFVVQEWMNSSGCLKVNAPIQFASDGDGALTSELGLAQDMGFGLGVRSKRFVIVLDNNRVQTVLTDPGIDSCSATSASNLVALLTPVSGVSEPVEVSPVVVGGLAVVVAAVVALSSGGFGGSSGTVAASTASRPSTVRTVPSTERKSSSKQETSFSLINEYLNTST